MELGDNVQAAVDDKGILAIRIDTKKAGNKSTSGKSTVIASTRGNKQIAANGKVLNLGVNLYVKS